MSTRFQMDNGELDTVVISYRSLSTVLDLDEGAAGYRISNPPVHLVVPVMGFLEVYCRSSFDID